MPTADDSEDLYLHRAAIELGALRIALADGRSLEGVRAPLEALEAMPDDEPWDCVAVAHDAFHAAVTSFSRGLASVRVVTTDEVLTEVLSHFAGLGPYWRAKVAALVHDVRSDPVIDVLPQTRADFDAALALYEARPDKEYSFTDCRSITALRALGIIEVLTNDHHFTQEGFTILFP